MLKADRLTKRFGGLEAVRNLSLTVHEGEIVGLIGPNGSGKTTTMNLLSGFAVPNGGEVYLRGDRITGQRPYAIAKKGLVRTFQLTSVFSELSVLENVIHGSHRLARSSLFGSLLRSRRYRKEERSTQERASRVLEFAGIERRRWDLAAKHLSAGEQRFLEIAIALAADPAVILLDEPATGLSPAETEGLVSLIGRMLGDGRTVVLVEHNMRLVMGICHRIAVLNLGEQIAEGTPAEIAADQRVIEAYLGRRRVDA